MPYRQQNFSNGEIYHVTLKRIGDDLLFKDENDSYRGIFSIYEFNTSDLVTIRERRKARARIKQGTSSDRVADVLDKRNLLVEILSFCFMPNHIHLLLKQIQDGGISKFMQKFGAGYACYFKRKHGLSKRGHFFQDRFVAVPVKDDDQLKTVFVYIHTNPLSLVEANWKERGIKNQEKAIEFLKSYKWSSYPDYIGRNNFSSVTKREFLSEVIGGIRGCKDFVENWVRYKGGINEFVDLALED